MSFPHALPRAAAQSRRVSTRGFSSPGALLLLLASAAAAPSRSRAAKACCYHCGPAAAAAAAARHRQVKERYYYNYSEYPHGHVPLRRVGTTSAGGQRVESSQQGRESRPEEDHDQDKHQKRSGDEKAAAAAAAASSLLTAPPAAEKQESIVQSLQVGGAGVRLDVLGPLVVNRDGSTGRVANWAEMTEGERDTTLKLLARRNKQRLEALRQSEVDTPVK